MVELYLIHYKYMVVNYLKQEQLDGEFNGKYKNL